MNKNRKKKYLITGLIVFLLLLAVLFVFSTSNKSGSIFANRNSEERSGGQAGTDNKTGNSSDQDEKNSDQNEQSGDSDGSGNSEMPTGQEWRNESNSDNYIDISDLFVSVDDVNNKNTNVSLPYSIPGSSLVLNNYTSYSGDYIEDGKDEPVKNVAVIAVANTADKVIEYCEISLTVNGQKLLFKGSALQPNSKTLIMAADKGAYIDGAIEKCSAMVSEGTDVQLSGNEIEVLRTEPSLIEIKNITDHSIPMVRVFYKYYSPESDGYIGGIAYTSKAEDLPAGQSVNLNPSHFAGDESKIVKIQTYDSKD